MVLKAVAQAISSYVMSVFFFLHSAFIEILSVVSLLFGGGLKPRHNLSWSKTMEDSVFGIWGFLIRRCWLNRGGIYLLILSHLLQECYGLYIFVVVPFLIRAWAIINVLFSGVYFGGLSCYNVDFMECGVWAGCYQDNWILRPMLFRPILPFSLGDDARIVELLEDGNA